MSYRPVNAPPTDHGAGSDVVDGPAALDAALAGRAAFIDIRRPDEWMATGMPQGATGITMEDPTFLDQVRAAAGGEDRPVILICRSGNRSGHALARLRAEGFTDVVHVGEGMVGSVYGPGWLARGLPLKSYP